VEGVTDDYCTISLQLRPSHASFSRVGVVCTEDCLTAALQAQQAKHNPVNMIIGGFIVEMTMGMGFPMGMGIPWEWELLTKLGMGRNGNRLHGNGREWECKKPFPCISSL